MGNEPASTPARRPPAMADVAKLAGVSAQTVSRTLRDHPHVQPATRARVLAAVEQLGYRRNSAARALASGRTLNIGLVMLSTTSYSAGTARTGIETAARQAGYAVTTVTAASVAPEHVEQALSLVADQGAEGVVLMLPLIATTPRIDELTRLIPTVATDGSRTPWAEVVAVDQRKVGRMATQHLLDLGHETVWHVAGPARWLESVQRTEGWRAALAEAGIQPPPELPGDWSPESGYQAGKILGQIPSATAVFVGSDEMAFGVLRALRELGRHVPDDVSVVGVDNIALAPYATPPLTSVAQSFEQVGAQAVTQLLRLMDHRGTTPEQHEQHLVEPLLFVRGSTGPR